MEIISSVMTRPVEIDGAYGEGGGQVLRTALTLSTLTGTPVRVRNIRARRRNPGLAPQHVTGLLALAQICEAKVAGAAVGSPEITFEPTSEARPGSYAFDVSETAKAASAGSVTLILQTLLMPLAFASAGSHLRLKGGTHIAWSPPFDFISDVYLPTLSRMGFRVRCRLAAWGFYPIGGGQIAVDIDPLRAESADRPVGKPHVSDGQVGRTGSMPLLHPLTLVERGRLRHIRGRAVACNLPEHVVVRMANRVHELLTGEEIDCQIAPQRVRGKGPGAGVFATAEYEHTVAGFSALGERGRPAERVAEEMCRDLLDHHESGAPVTAHLADQLLLPMALTSGRSEVRTSRITQHLLTNAHIIRQFLALRIDIRGRESGPGEITVDGSGMV